ncbi:nuclease-related domain-containing protein [Oceanobacillus sp. CAU 1775]
MIIKPLKPTHELLQIEALDKRLSPHHILKEEISLKARNLRAGYNGERALQFPLSFLPEDDFLIFHHLRLPDKQGFFQIDTLLLSTNYILIIEVKNIRDTITFDDMGQTFREEHDVIQGFSNPVDQVNLQHLRLLRWLKKLKLPPIPIEKIVTYTNPTTFLKNLTKKDDLPKVVMHKEKILDKINEISNMHQEKRVSDDELLKLAYQLILEHTEAKFDVFKKYGIRKDEIIKGVACEECSFIPMSRAFGKWFCSGCQSTSKNAHQAALLDYALLVNEYISNQEVKEFLQLKSRDVTKRLLLKENFQQFGERSGRKYHINIDKYIE